LSIDVRLRPAGPVLIEVLQVEGAGRVGTRTQGGHRVDDLAPGLTTFVVRWPDHRGRTPVRTAWMLL
ncbi:MAG TPA: hypothetical protein VK894_04450, partial [Jiangellales bacterium]|nr:hypothetical protein [Jiangellales bacterium]